MTRDYPPDSRQRAIEMRQQGCSYGMISEELGVPKSTLSYWLRGVEYTPGKEVITRVGLGRLKGGETRRLQTAERIEEVRSQAVQELEISNRDLWIAGIAIYWSDGTKAQEEVRFTNSDPQIVRLMMLWFREVCLVPETKFRAEIHLYPDSNIEEATAFWSEVTNIPAAQFSKCQIDRRSNKRQKKKRLLPHGTIQIRVGGGQSLGRDLHRRIMGWVEALQDIKRE